MAGGEPAASAAPPALAGATVTARLRAALGAEAEVDEADLVAMSFPVLLGAHQPRAAPRPCGHDIDTRSASPRTGNLAIAGLRECCIAQYFTSRCGFVLSARDGWRRASTHPETGYLDRLLIEHRLPDQAGDSNQFSITRPAMP